MKRLRAPFLAIFLLAALTSPAWAAENQGDRANASALTLASGRASAGQADPHVTVTPSGGSSQSAIVCANSAPNWASALPGSRWISLQADCNSGSAVTDATTYVYSTTFTLPANHAAARIDGRVIVDDTVTIQLNGSTIFTGGSFGVPTAFSSTNAALFTTGVNTLTFTVYNASAQSGLDYVARVPGVRALRNRANDNNNVDRGERRRGDR